MMTDYTLTDNDKETLVALLQDLVRIPSVNSDNPAEPAESRISEYLGRHCDRMGMEVDRLITPGNRPNVLASVTGDGRERLVLAVHMDTVSVEGMVDPFGARVRDKKVWGRGACDTKGAMSSYLWALAKIRELGLDLPWQVDFLAVCDEETGCTGSRWLTEQGVTAEYMIIGEPTGCQIATCHRGRITLKLATRGKAAHASVADRGVNAIYHMADILAVVRRQWIPTLGRDRDSRLGTTTANVTMINGGLSDNIVPDRCQIVIDVRTIPGLEYRAFIDNLHETLEPYARSNGIDLTIEAAAICHAFDSDPDSLLVRNMLAARKNLGLPSEPTAVPYLSDASNFAQTGAQCIVFGPGHVAQAHAVDEYLELDQLFLSAEILLRFFLDQAV